MTYTTIALVCICKDMAALRKLPGIQPGGILRGRINAIGGESRMYSKDGTMSVALLRDPGPELMQLAKLPYVVLTSFEEMRGYKGELSGYGAPYSVAQPDKLIKTTEYDEQSKEYVPVEKMEPQPDRIVADPIYPTPVAPTAEGLTARSIYLSIVGHDQPFVGLSGIPMDHLL